MPEPTNNGAGTTPTDNNSSATPGGSQPKPNSDNGAGTFDTSKVTEEQLNELTKSEAFWKVAFGHERFKSLNDKAKKADEYESNKAKDEENRLVEQKKFEELATKRGNEATEWKTKFEKSLVDNKVIVEATKLGVIDADAVLSLLDRTNIKLTDAGITGVAEAIKALTDAKPYLLQKPSGTPNIGAGTNPGQDANNNALRFKASQIQDVKFYREHEKDILKAMQLGQIENDLPGQF